MSRIRIEKRGGLTAHRMMNVLTVALAVLLGFIVLLTYNTPGGITGGVVFQRVYGSASSLVIALILGVLIYVYMRVRRS